MAFQNLPSRVMQDVGLAAWFGGSLANAVSLNRAAGATRQDRDTGRVTNVGWAAWTPVNAVAIGVHVVGSVGVFVGNKGRVAGQQGVGTMSVVLTALTGAAIAATAYSGVLGRKVAKHGDVPAESGTEPAPATPPEVATAQRQLKVLQWVIPALTGSMIVVTSWAGEQQRPTAVVTGVMRRLNPFR